MNQQSDIGVIGLAVMGSNLARNLASKGYGVAVYNRTQSVTEEFSNQFGADGQFFAASDLESFVGALSRPRKIILMVKAGNAVDLVTEQLKPLLDQDDIIVDGGNALYKDTRRREKALREEGFHFLGVGISGGEEGALNGPSIMPGGKKEAWQQLSEMFAKISAQVEDGPCTTYIGPDGAGHFVKMVHNGIEYADMQLLAESYHVLSELAGLDNGELSKLFAEWNKGALSSYLVEITAEVFKKRDDQTEGFLVDQILDAAGQKGTGRWTVQAALELGVATPAIAAAVHARILSALKSQRVAFSKIAGSDTPATKLPDTFPSLCEQALLCGKVLAYAEGFALMQSASEEYNWQLNLSEVSRIWKGGCIIRARLLDTLQEIFKEKSLQNMLFHKDVQAIIARSLPALREFISFATSHGIPVPAHTAALSYYDMLRHERLPQNLTQAQRDLFGAHTFKRLDMDGTFHADW